MDQSGKIEYRATDLVSTFEEALRNGRTEVVGVLSVHLDCSIWDKEHRTPLWYASYFGRLFAIDMPFRQDCMNKPDRSGHTPLMAAATAGLEKALNRLCSHEAYLVGNTKTAARLDNFLDLWRVNDEGKTARDLAIDNGHHACAEFMSAWMETPPMPIYG